MIKHVDDGCDDHENDNNNDDDDDDDDDDHHIHVESCMGTRNRHHAGIARP